MSESDFLKAASSPPQIPDHDLLRCIGKGAYGEVWLARNIMGTWRAVKIVYRRNFEDGRPFERELKGIQKFEPISRSHDSQVDILQVGRAYGYFFYVMELADDQQTGQQINPVTYRPKTLKSEGAQRGTLLVDECVAIGLQLTTALEHLHSEGLVHRDIKPSNIIFINGVPKLADIGLVTSADATQSVVGTNGYFPAQGAGTPQGDIYSLGKVLYELSTGRDRQDFPELPTSLAEHREREHFLEFNAIVSKACAPERKHRYASAEAMRQDLLVIQSGRSVRRIFFVERRLQRLTRFAAAMSVLILAALAAYALQNHSAKTSRSLEQRLGSIEAENQRLKRRFDSLSNQFNMGEIDYSKPVATNLPAAGPITNRIDATARAIFWANRKAESLLLHPFSEGSALAERVGDVWIWKGRAAEGTGDVEITVVLHADGSVQSCTSRMGMFIKRRFEELR